MKIAVTVILLFLSSIFYLNANAECVRDSYGNVVCGKGQCAKDQYSKVFCADAGGGAVKNRNGIVQCGVGYCKEDYLGYVWCSKEPGGGAERDSHGKVVCFGGCDPASSELCKEATK